MTRDNDLLEMQRNFNALKERVDELWRRELLMGNYGWINANWQKDPLRLGYSGDASAQVEDTNASSGTNTLLSSAVPAGEIWILEAVAGADISNAPARILLGANVNGVGVYFDRDENPVTSVYSGWSGAITLAEGDQVAVQFHGVTAGDTIRMHYHIRKIEIDQ